MKATFLGTGTSIGIPVIGCDCPVCRSEDPRNRRLRTGLFLESDHFNILIDTPPDFREQALTHNIRRVDAVLFTHTHADHIFGFDDIRRFNTIQQSVIPAYGSRESIADLLRIFDYVGTEKVPGLYRPQIEFCEITGPFKLGNINIEPLRVEHGPGFALGFLFRHGDQTFGYVPDCGAMPDEVVEKLSGVDVMVLDALRHKPHRTHLTLEDSIGLLQRIAAKRSFVIHMCHDLDHEELCRTLPDGIKPSFDGLVVEL